MAGAADERRQLAVSTTVRDVSSESARLGNVVREIFKPRKSGGKNTSKKTRIGGDFRRADAANQIEEGVRSARMAYEYNADFVDLNCGCPTHEVTKRGLGARLLRKPAKLARLVEGLASGSPLPLSVKIRLGDRRR